MKIARVVRDYLMVSVVVLISLAIVVRVSQLASVVIKVLI